MSQVFIIHPFWVTFGLKTSNEVVLLRVSVISSQHLASGHVMSALTVRYVLVEALTQTGDGVLHGLAQQSVATVGQTGDEGTAVSVPPELLVALCEARFPLTVQQVEPPVVLQALFAISLRI